MCFLPLLQIHIPVFRPPNILSPPPPKKINKSEKKSLPFPKFVKPIHCNNRMEINGQILCSQQLSSIKIHPAAWPLSTDQALCMLTQFLLDWQRAGCRKTPDIPPSTPARLLLSCCVGCPAACLPRALSPSPFPIQLEGLSLEKHHTSPRLYKQTQF